MAESEADARAESQRLVEPCSASPSPGARAHLELNQRRERLSKLVGISQALSARHIAISHGHRKYHDSVGPRFKAFRRR